MVWFHSRLWHQLFSQKCCIMDSSSDLYRQLPAGIGVVLVSSLFNFEHNSHLALVLLLLTLNKLFPTEYELEILNYTRKLCHKSRRFRYQNITQRNCSTNSALRLIIKIANPRLPKITAWASVKKRKEKKRETSRQMPEGCQSKRIMQRNLSLQRLQITIHRNPCNQKIKPHALPHAMTSYATQCIYRESQ